jgi:hypothetical protein
MDMIKNINKPVFIIAHKYYRGYDSYCEYYIQTIQKFYEESLIIIVDNNSTHKEDIFEKLRQYENVILLDNNIECKFEIGAYQIGLKYLMDNNIYWDYSYIVMTQDTFIIKNKVDFNELHKQNVLACPIVDCHGNLSGVHIGYHESFIPILEQMNLNYDVEKSSFCWCNSFIISSEKIETLYSFIKDIVITERWGSCVSERYLGRILWEINDRKKYDIDGDLYHVQNLYDSRKVDVYTHDSTFFVKKLQQKTEQTVDR